MIQFLQDYWFVVVSIVLAVAELLILVLKKNKINVMDSAFESVLQKLPVIITSAEKIFGAGNGDKKKDYCLKFAIGLYDSLGGVDDKSYIRVLLAKAIDDILATPQKKG